MCYRRYGTKVLATLLNKNGNLHLLANQSLKLTEPAVDDFARAKQSATIGLDIPRAEWLPSLRRFAAAA